MPSHTESVESVAARKAQSAASKRATIETLLSKPRAEQELTLQLPTGNGEHKEVSFLFRAIGSKEYDQQLTRHPPTTSQKGEGANYNIHTFAPALLSRVCVDPELTEKQWGEVWESPDWNRGEVMQLFLTAVNLCNTGMELVPTTEDV